MFLGKAEQLFLFEMYRWKHWEDGFCVCFFGIGSCSIFSMSVSIDIWIEVYELREFQLFLDATKDPLLFQ